MDSEPNSLSLWRLKKNHNLSCVLIFRNNCHASIIPLILRSEAGGVRKCCKMELHLGRSFSTFKVVWLLLRKLLGQLCWSLARKREGICVKYLQAHRGVIRMLFRRMLVVSSRRSAIFICLVCFTDLLLIREKNDRCCSVYYQSC